MKFKGLTNNLLLRFFACQLYMGLVKKANKKEYWVNSTLFSTQLKSILTFREYYLISRFLHLSNNDQPEENNSMWKIQEFHDKIYSKFTRYYQAGSFLTIDEYIGHFKGKAPHCKVYQRDKPYKWGIKEYLLVDSITHYTLRSIYYYKPKKSR